LALQAHEHPPWWNRVSATDCEAQLLAQGIRHDTTVVLYGRDMTAAARAAVLLMYAGVNDVRLLDGGLTAWRAAGYPLETMPHRPVPVSDFGKMIPGHPEYIIDTEEAKDLLSDTDTALVCVRSWAEYVGATSGYPYIKAKGRIAGALWGHAGSVPRCLDHYRNIDNTMRNYHEIATNWQSWGVTSDKRVAFYCGTGWRASEAFFSAYLMGWKQIAVYDGGWWEWSQDTSNPIACGDPRR
jgi:thiosulfate/3-mercaptopyruvate sulfurtransferase